MVGIFFWIHAVTGAVVLTYDETDCLTCSFWLAFTMYTDFFTLRTCDVAATAVLGIPLGIPA